MKAHGHYVKVSFDKLPDTLQEKVLTYKNMNEKSSLLYPGQSDNFSIGTTSYGTRASTAFSRSKAGKSAGFVSQVTNKFDAPAISETEHEARVAKSRVNQQSKKSDKTEDDESKAILMRQISKLSRASITGNLKKRRNTKEVNDTIESEDLESPTNEKNSK